MYKTFSRKLPRMIRHLKEEISASGGVPSAWKTIRRTRPMRKPSGLFSTTSRTSGNSFVFPFPYGLKTLLVKSFDKYLYIYLYKYFISRLLLMHAVLRIRIHRIHMFFGLPDSDTSQRYRSGSGSCSGSGSFYHHAKMVRKTLIPTIL
jgi:hypothetical protein